MIIAIDGPVGSGKSAVGRRVAEALGVPFVDTGLMYRAIAALALERGLEIGDGAALSHLANELPVRVEGRRVWAGEEELTDRVYRPEISNHVSLVAKVAGVRVAMVAQQRALGKQGVVMAGRDIGTVVFPDADHKFFLTAGLQERVRRRAVQLEQRGERADREAMTREVEERDRLDTGRTVAPLRPAPDALVVATDALDLAQVVRLLLERIGAR